MAIYDHAEVAIPMATTRLTKQEREWGKESDARTLATAKIIVNDPARLTGAKQAAARMAEEEKKEVTAMDAVSKIKPNQSLQDGPKPDEKAKPRRKKATPPVNKFNTFQKI